MLKDDEDLSKLPLKDGASVMLIGTAEVVKEPQEKVSPWVGADAAAFGVWGCGRGSGPRMRFTHKHPLQNHTPPLRAGGVCGGHDPGGGLQGRRRASRRVPQPWQHLLHELHPPGILFILVGYIGVRPCVPAKKHRRRPPICDTVVTNQKSIHQQSTQPTYDDPSACATSRSSARR